MSQTLSQMTPRLKLTYHQLGLQNHFPDPNAPRETQVQLQASPAWTLVVVLLAAIGLSVGGAVWAYLVWSDEGLWVVWIFVVVLEAVGLVLLAVFFHQLLARRKVAPPEVFVSVQPVYLGETFTVRVRQSFKGSCQLNRITLKLICREEATYRRGTSTYTDRRDVYEEAHTLAEAQQMQPGDVLEEELQLKIPEDAMHTFAAQWNKILWYLHLHVDIAAWPDFKEDFHFQVAPRRAEPAT